MTLFRADPAESPRTAHRFSRSIVGAESNLAIGLCRLSWQAGRLARSRRRRPAGHGHHCHPFPEVEGWHAPAGRPDLGTPASCPGQADQTGNAGGCQEPGPGRQIVSQDNLLMIGEPIGLPVSRTSRTASSRKSGRIRSRHRLILSDCRAPAASRHASPLNPVKINVSTLRGEAQVPASPPSAWPA